jgi:hypothetical protein
MRMSGALNLMVVSVASVRPVAIFNEELLLIESLIQPRRG